MSEPASIADWIEHYTRIHQEASQNHRFADASRAADKLEKLVRNHSAEIIAALRSGDHSETGSVK